MSMYNMLFGKNPSTSILLSMIGLTESQIPRIRDVYLEDDYIMIYTRTGGGNREHYGERNADNKEGPWNTNISESPYYVSDYDDSFDRTYAHWKMRIPTQFKEAVDALRVDDGGNPRAKWDNIFKVIEKGDPNDPLFKRAEAVMKPIIDKLNTATSITIVEI